MEILSLLGFKKAIETARREPTVPRLVRWIEAAHVHHDRMPDRVDGKPFEPGRCYFGLRLAGLHLRDARRFATERLPLCICLAEFHLGGKPQTIPFCLGPDTIRQKLTTAAGPPAGGQAGPQPGWVELRDIEIVRPTPVSRGNVESFIGLYSVPGDDVARTLLNVLGSVSQAVGGALAPALGIAEKVYDGFNTLLGVQNVTPEAEALLGSLLRNSGYLLVSGLPENSPLQAGLHVVDGRLRHGPDKTSPLVVGFDYCLLAVERYDTVVDSTQTAPDLFGLLWSEVVDAFDKGKEAPELAFKRLQRSIYGSPLLIPADRDVLLAGYLVEYRNAGLVLGGGVQVDGSRSAAGRRRGLDELTAEVARFPDLYSALTEEPPAGMSREQAKEHFAASSTPLRRAAGLRAALAAEAKPGDLSEIIVRARDD